MTCTEVREDLIAWLDGELDVRQAARLGEHLDGCAACRAIAEQHRAVWRLLDHDADVPVAPGFVARVLERLGLARRPAGRTAPAFRGVWIAAAAALLLVLLPIGLQQVSPGTSGDLSNEELEAALDMDLLENLELLHALDVLAEVDDPAVLKDAIEIGEEVY